MPLTVTGVPSVLSDTCGRPAADTAVEAARRRLAAKAVVVLLAVCAFAPTIGQRGHYSDDYPNRQAVEGHGVWGAWSVYRGHAGFIRPAGYLSLFAADQWLWDRPVAQQALLLTFHVLLCLLTFRLAEALSGDSMVGLAAAGLLAAWPSFTCTVAWVAAGMMLPPAFALLLLALLFYVQALRSDRPGRWHWAAVGAFTASVLFHDQHLATAGVFSMLALLVAQPGRRRRGLLKTAPFWMVALATGLVAMGSAQSSERPLEPALGGLAMGLVDVVGEFARASIITPLRHSLAHAGPAASLSRMAETHPAALAGSVLLLLAAVTGMAWLWRGRSTPQPHTSYGRLALTGAAIFVAGLAVMALRESHNLQSRHTLLPAIGLSLLLAAGWGWLRTGRGRSIAGLALPGLLIALSMLRLGYAYEWTTRTRVTESVLASLEQDYPEAVDGELLVIDGVRGYGRGFADSWGLTSALSMQRGTDLRVATMVRREGSQLIANAAWDRAWIVDPTATRFFAWNEAAWTLRPVSLETYLERHPGLRAVTETADALGQPRIGS